MQAAVFVRAGQPLELQDLPDPEPGAGQVILKIIRCGICATDLHMTGDHDFAAPSGFVLGHERGAEVVALGKGVERLKVGDHVVPHNSEGCGHCDTCRRGIPFFCTSMHMNMGGFAQYMLCGEHVCAKLPETLPLDDAALVEPLAVGLHATQLSGIKVGARIAVIGAGPMGLAALFWAKRAGAGPLAMIATSRTREAIARGMGADAFLTNSDNLTDEVHQAIGGAPDVVFECTGSAGAITRSVDMVKPTGTVTVVGMCTAADSWVPAFAMLKEVRIQFAVGTSVPQFLQVADILHAGHVEPRLMITDTVSLGQLPDAFEALKGGSHHCKVMVAPWA